MGPVYESTAVRLDELGLQYNVSFYAVALR